MNQKKYTGVGILHGLNKVDAINGAGTNALGATVQELPSAGGFVRCTPSAMHAIKCQLHRHLNKCIRRDFGALFDLFAAKYVENEDTGIGISGNCAGILFGVVDCFQHSTINGPFKALWWAQL